MEPLNHPVDVYFNLHRKLWSVRNRKTGLVEHHTRAVIFPYGAEMIVQPAGRLRVLETGTKTVHAFIRGERAEIAADPDQWEEFGLRLKGSTRVTYRPRQADHFIEVETGEAICAASAVVMVAAEGKPPQVWAVKRIQLEA